MMGPLSMRSSLKPLVPVIALATYDVESHEVENLFICDGSVMPRDAGYGYGALVGTIATYVARRIVTNHFTI